TSRLHIRKLNPEYPNEDCAFLVVDGHSLMVRPKVDQQTGYALHNDPGKARLRQSQFDQAWDHSLSDPDLRSFLL
ncbi:MAG TPA: histone acetyltransferase HPA2, partial [Pseudomonas nitrititolerans]|nr:histone acetyltransferase HPA2 [Stutzerimonas nitrititolerans]